MKKFVLALFLFLSCSLVGQVSVSSVNNKGSINIAGNPGTTGPAFYGTLYSSGENEASLVPSDFANPTDPPFGNGVVVGSHPSNAVLDPVFGTPVWKICDMAVSGAASYAFSSVVDDQKRWAACTNTQSDTTGYTSKKIVNLWTGATYCNIANLDTPSGFGHADTIREPFSATGYVVNSVVTIVSGSIPENKTLTNTDIIINGTTYQISNDNGTLTLSQAGVNVGSVGSPVEITAGWNDQDILLGTTHTGQIVRVNLRVCNGADTAQTTGPTQPSWEVWDTITDASSKWGNGRLFLSMEQCGNVYGDMSTDGNSMAIGDNTDNVGNTMDCRRYTFGTKGGTTGYGGTLSTPLDKWKYYPISSITCTAGTKTCNVTTTGSPDYRVGQYVHLDTPNFCCSGPNSAGFKFNSANTCRIGSVTDANTFTLASCPTFTTNVNDTSGYIVFQGRSAHIDRPLADAVNLGDPVADHYMTYVDGGDSATCQAFTISSVSRNGSGTGTLVLASTPYPAWAKGIQFTIAGTTNFNGTYLVASVTNSTTFTFTKTGTTVSESTGTASVCGENVLWVSDSNSGHIVRKSVGDAGHIVEYVDQNNDMHIIQYGGKYVNSKTQGYITMTGANDNCGLFDWNFSTDALVCVVPAPYFDSGNEEFYDSKNSYANGTANPYVLITLSDNSMRAMPYPKYSNPAGLPASNANINIASITRDGSGTGTVTLSTAPSPNWIVGDPFSVSGTTNFNGTYTVAGVVNSTTYTFSKSGTTVTEAVGTVKIPNLVEYMAASTAGDCHSSGGSQIAWCDWYTVAGSDGTVNDWGSPNYGTVPLGAGTITVSGGVYAGTQAYDWTKTWIYQCCNYANGTNSAFVPSMGSDEILLWDVVNQKLYHVAHTYTRQVEAFYSGKSSYNTNAHINTSRDGTIACFDSSWGPNQHVAAYCAQILK